MLVCWISAIKASENKAMLFWWTSTNANTVASEATFSNGYVVERHSSGPALVTSGVRHGNVVGLLLFLLYINDVPQKVAFVSHLFVYRKIKMKQDSQIVQHDLKKKLQEFEKDWKMSFNPSNRGVISGSEILLQLPAPPQS